MRENAETIQISIPQLLNQLRRFRRFYRPVIYAAPDRGQDHGGKIIEGDNKTDNLNDTYAGPLLLFFWKDRCRRRLKLAPSFSTTCQRLYGLKVDFIDSPPVRERSVLFSLDKDATQESDESMADGDEPSAVGGLHIRDKKYGSAIFGIACFQSSQTEVRYTVSSKR